jgi:circadian clock protein KaiC
VRAALRSAIHTLNALGVTTVITAEQQDGHEPGYGLAEYLASVTVVLGNDLVGFHRRRTLEVLKARGMYHLTGQFPFIIGQGGLHLLPVSYAGKPTSSRDRVTWGITELDTLCPRGLYDDSLIVVSGPTGSGKTTLAVEFALASPRSCMYSFEESAGQLRRNAVARGVAIDEALDNGDLHLRGLSARDASIDQHYMAIEQHVRQRRPQRVVIDGLAALEQSAGGNAARRFVERLSALAKAVPTLFLCTYTHASAAREELTGLHASPASDGIVVLRYLFRDGHALRYLTIMKLRGDNHDTRTHLLQLDDGGLRLGDPIDAALF